ncbi:MAG: acyl-CoA dehydratase activase [Armatimonadetes bacterium]|nr:acyl-CoA dehydratase activase [Armatimonadota bacterium]
MSQKSLTVGIDVGSVSVKLAVVDEVGNIVETLYVRHRGKHMQLAAEILTDVSTRYDGEITRLATTGAGGRPIAHVLKGIFVNEVVAQATATATLHPEVKTIIEIGGEDSKLIFLKKYQGEHTSLGKLPEIADFQMNTVCAAGTGSFLDQQASRMGLTIEEFGELALKSENPPRVAGRCSVFAKSDMIHLQQKATPVHDIVAGLCFALARNFKSTVGAARKLDTPIAFQGGVAANPGIVRALTSILELDEGGLIIPKDFGCMGAIGAALVAMHSHTDQCPDFTGIPRLLEKGFGRTEAKGDKPLRLEKSVLPTDNSCDPKPTEKIPAYLGVDVGSISTNIVVMDSQKRILAKRYLMTASRPIEAVRRGLQEIGDEIGDLVEIRGACTTGSGRYLIADFIGADVVRNEITAQARAAAEIDPEVDTIFEIGGQDSKYISLQNGAIVDFEMNKVCAAGTGSFLEEQAEKLGINIKEEFGNMALASLNPANLGERCTVFIESELVRHQQAGVSTEDLVGGLSYSIVRNYLNRVVGTKPIGNKIFFQGGVAANKGVVAAFEAVTGKPIIVPKHHEVTGAIGCACIAMDEDKGLGSKFKGFDLSRLSYEITSFECKECANRCEINRVVVEGEKPLFYGSRCEKYDVDRRAGVESPYPDYFAERDEMLLAPYTPSEAPSSKAPRVGIPRALLFYELYPFWQAFLKELGCEVVISDPTTKKIIHNGAERSVAETCFPMKVALGHTLNLLEKEIDYVFLPSVINLPLPDKRMTDSFVCPYVQSLCYTIKSAIDFNSAGVKVLQPVVYLQLGRKHKISALESVGRALGRSRNEVVRAVEAAEQNLALFQERLRKRGKEVLADIRPDEKAIVVIGRAYNTCDPGANLEIPKKLGKMGVRCIPMDFLPLDDVRLPDEWKNMYWRYGQKILSAGEIVAEDKRLYPLYLTNFGCGPDSFVHKFFRERLGAKPSLVIEVDEHSADAGMITRCEAFLDSIVNANGKAIGGRFFRPVNIEPGTHRIVLIPNMSAHAHALAGAFEACGMKAEVLPEPDDETLELGRQFTTGKECFPCIVTTGDMVKFVRRPDFDRNKYAFFMGGSGGPCRFGQYNALQRMVLDQLGYPDVPIYAPNQASSFYNDIGIVGRKLLTLGWRGIVAMDLLEKCLRETRPYEVVKGAAENAFSQSVEIVRRAIAQEADLVQALKQCRALFEKVEIDRSVQKPIIGYVGEFYVRANAFSNQDIIRCIEELGGEVWAAPINEWFLYRNVRRAMRSRLAGDARLWLKNYIQDKVMQRDERELSQVFHGFLRNAEEPTSNEVLDFASPYVHRSFEGEAIMTIGKAIDFIQKGLCGIVAVMPFTCMPGTIANAIMKRVREECGEFPFLNMVYDGVEQATARTRIEAFMHQAKEYMKKARTVTSGVHK